MTAAGRITPPVGSQPPGARVPGVPPPLYFGAALAAGMALRADDLEQPVVHREQLASVAAAVEQRLSVAVRGRLRVA